MFTYKKNTWIYELFAEVTKANAEEANDTSQSAIIGGAVAVIVVIAAVAVGLFFLHRRMVGRYGLFSILE